MRIGQPAYYSSREVKEIGPQQEKIRGSRATGVLLTDDDVFAVYNAGGSEIKWACEMDGDSPMLFGYTCDMPRIKRFVSGLGAHKLRGVLYCFDFQKDALRQICGPNVNIRCIDFEKFEELL